LSKNLEGSTLWSLFSPLFNQWEYLRNRARESAGT
jgi:hypothetical protein